MKLLRMTLLASIFLGGCAVQQPINLDAFYAHRPRSIAVVPVLNESPEVSAPSVFITTISRPLAERGYYVFPVYLTDMILRDFGLTEAGHIHQLPPSRFYELFGADAVLFVTIKDWSTKYLVLASTVDVRMEYVLKDTKTGIELWRNEQTYSHQSGGAGSGLIGMAVSAAINALVTDYMPLARMANQVVLMPPRGLPAGQYSPNYQATGNNTATLKQLPLQKKDQITAPIINTEKITPEAKTVAPVIAIKPVEKLQAPITTNLPEKPLIAAPIVTPEKITPENKTVAPVIAIKPIEKIQSPITTNLPEKPLIAAPIIPIEKIVSESKTTSAIVVSKKTPKKSQTFSDRIKAIQTALQSKDYYEGDINGELNRETKAAISLYKEVNNLSGDSIDKSFLRALGIR